MGVGGVVWFQGLYCEVLLQGFAGLPGVEKVVSQPFGFRSLAAAVSASDRRTAKRVLVPLRVIQGVGQPGEGAR